MTERRAQWRRVVTVLLVIACAAAAGYVATCAIFPAPLLPKAVSLPDVRGMPVDSVLARLSALGLRARISDTVVDPFTSAGTVAWESPAPETMLPAGAIVRLGVSNGSPAAIVPDVTDLDATLARSMIGAAGLIVSGLDTVRSDVTFGAVIGTDPAVGTALKPGSPVRITVSTGPATIAIPDLAGLTLTAARDRLEALDLRVGTLDQRAEGTPGTVVSQHPAAGTMTTRQSAVDLTISGTVP